MGHGFVVAGAAAVLVVAGLFVFFPRGKSKRPLPPPAPVAPAAPSPATASAQETPPIDTVEEPAVAPARPEVPPSGKRHVEITVQPAEASLFLDNRMAGGNAIKMDVAKAKTVHVVQAKAPGYATFKKTISYANDTYLDIKLEKVEVAQPRIKARPTPTAVTKEAKPEVKEVKEPKEVKEVRSETRPAPAAAAPVEDFGMTLQRPAPRRPTKRIDETDPYAP